jgi:preprotein translocase subunit YajC
VWTDIAYAAGAQATRGIGELFNSVFLFLPLIAIFYFMIFRPQQKQRREMQQMLANLKKGDSIVTRGGIEAIIDKVEEKRLRIEVGNGIKMWMNRDYVDRLETK